MSNNSQESSLRSQKNKVNCARVDWVDSNGFGHWHPREDEKNEPSHCVSVGMIEKEDKVAITLILSLDAALDRVDSSITIPKCSVKSLKRFKI